MTTTIIMRRFLRRSLPPIALTPCCTHQFRQLASTAAAEVETDTVLFPRVGPGISYGLNWALATKGVPPKEEVFRNLKDLDLQRHGGTTAGKFSGSSVYAVGSFSAGAVDISKAQFNRLLKQVQAHLSSLSKLFVHDGAVGSFPSEDVRVRFICDDASAAFAIKNVLCRTPLRVVHADSFPLTVYVASGSCASASDLEQFGLTSKAENNFLAVDYDRCALILGGKAFADASSVKSTLAALAAPSLMSKGGLPLAARILVQGDSTVLLLAPESIVQGSPAVLEASVTTDANSSWSAPGGLATFFSPVDNQAPNLFQAPASFVLVTVDSSGVIPTISKLTPSQAAYYFLAGYNGKFFVPAYQDGPLSVDPLSLAKSLLAKLTDSGVPAFLINASEGEKIMSGKDMLKLIEATVSQKLPKSKGKKASEAAVEALKSQYANFMAKRFPELPEGISL